MSNAEAAVTLSPASTRFVYDMQGEPHETAGPSKRLQRMAYCGSAMMFGALYDTYGASKQHIDTVRAVDAAIDAGCLPVLHSLQAPAVQEVVREHLVWPARQEAAMQMFYAGANLLMLGKVGDRFMHVPATQAARGQESKCTGNEATVRGWQLQHELGQFLFDDKTVAVQALFLAHHTAAIPRPERKEKDPLEWTAASFEAYALDSAGINFGLFTQIKSHLKSSAQQGLQLRLAAQAHFIDRISLRVPWAGHMTTLVGEAAAALATVSPHGDLAPWPKLRTL
jgi:hypothetical protein